MGLGRGQRNWPRIGVNEESQRRRGELLVSTIRPTEKKRYQGEAMRLKTYISKREMSMLPSELCMAIIISERRETVPSQAELGQQAATGVRCSSASHKISQGWASRSDVGQEALLLSDMPET